MQPVFVGDVQGCATELDDLLTQAWDRFGAGFEPWIVGDVINRGPGNRQALEQVRDLVEAGRARLVLGNHEIGFLAAHLGLRELRSSDTFGDLLGAADAREWFGLAAPAAAGRDRAHR